MLDGIVHTVHVVLAGVWLGGVVFTTFVVSPALKAMKWGEAERVLTRSAIGKQYARVGSVNLALLALFAILDGFVGSFRPVLYVEYVLVIALFGLVAAHGAYFGTRLRGLAEAERRAAGEEEAHALAERRRSLQRLSLAVSWADLLVSVAVLALAVNAM
jgi:uncharacterized membrane protein